MRPRRWSRNTSRAPARVRVSPANFRSSPIWSERHEQSGQWTVAAPCPKAVLAMFSRRWRGWNRTQLSSDADRPILRHSRGCWDRRVPIEHASGQRWSRRGPGLVAPTPRPNRRPAPSEPSSPGRRSVSIEERAEAPGASAGVGPWVRTVSSGGFDRLAATALCWKRPSRDSGSTTSGSRNRGHARRLGDNPKVRVFGSPSEGGLWSPPKAEGLAFGAFVCAAASLTRHLTGQRQRACVDRPDLLQRVA